jgi:integrase
MARSQGITDEGIAELRPAASGKRYEVPVGGVPNLFLRVGSRRKVFVLLARFGGAKNASRRAIGEFPDTNLEEAKTTAQEWNALVDQGGDPRAEKIRIAQEETLKRRRTFRSAIEDYIAYMPSRQRNRSVPKQIRDIKRNVLTYPGKLLDKPISEVTDEDVAMIVVAVRDRPAPAQAYNIFGVLRGFFRWIVAPGRRTSYGLPRNPIADVTPAQLELRRRIRTTTLQPPFEIRAFVRVAESTSYPYGPLFETVLKVGTRRSDVALGTWDEIDWNRKLWTIPESRDKNGQIHLIPLTPAMLALLGQIRDNQTADHGPYIFSTTDGHTPVNGFSSATRIFRRKMHAELEQMCPGWSMSPWVLHDMRRVVRSALAALDVAENVAELIIGHGKRGMARVYDQYKYERQMRAALRSYDDALIEMVRGRTNYFGDDIEDGDCWFPRGTEPVRRIISIEN